MWMLTIWVQKTLPVCKHWCGNEAERRTGEFLGASSAHPKGLQMWWQSTAPPGVSLTSIILWYQCVPSPWDRERTRNPVKGPIRSFLGRAGEPKWVAVAREVCATPGVAVVCAALTSRTQPPSLASPTYRDRGYTVCKPAGLSRQPAQPGWCKTALGHPEAKAPRWRLLHHGREILP